MPNLAGTHLGPYEILAPLGAGGMGEVWKARDTRLDRIVAVKVCSSQFSERFDREARAVAALNHPHICTLHDVGANYLVMEYIEGHTLKGPLPLAQALEYAAQICGALDAAHKRGIVHRDLKPANIMVTKSGVKLLDFGLAKLTKAVAADGRTDTIALTQAHTILGTLQYMAPEQLEGKEADARSDIFAFGALLHELVAGKPAFQGKTNASLIAAILGHDPPSVADSIPLPLDRLSSFWTRLPSRSMATSRPTESWWPIAPTSPENSKPTSRRTLDPTGNGRSRSTAAPNPGGGRTARRSTSCRRTAN
jgi:serine/threonine protein kinase